MNIKSVTASVVIVSLGVVGIGCLTPTEPEVTDTVTITSITPSDGSEITADQTITIKYDMDIDAVQDSMRVGLYFKCDAVSRLPYYISKVASSENSGTLSFRFADITKCTYATIGGMDQTVFQVVVEKQSGVLVLSGQATYYLL